MVGPPRKSSTQIILPHSIPSNEITRQRPRDRVVTSYLEVKNPSDERVVCFQVKTTAPKRYLVRPNGGVVDPDGRVRIAIELEPINSNEYNEKSHRPTKHKPQIATTNNNKTLDYRYPPFFITFISIFELVSFVYYALRSDELISLTGPVPFQSKLIYNPYRRYEVWRYLTYMFIHAGYWHLSFNLLIQLAVGIPLELVHKFNPIFIIYLGGVVGGSLGNSIADPHSYLAGASSGCYALIAAHLSNLIMNWSEIRGACCKLFTLVLFSATDFGTAVYERHFKVGSIAYRTSYGGHLAGALSGLLLGLIFLRNVRVYHWEQEVKKWAAGIYFGLVVSIRQSIICGFSDPKDRS